MIIDGSTNWGEDGPMPAAEGFDRDAREKSLYEWVRQVRGGVLAGAFTVERHISAAITYFMLGNRNLIPEVQEAFADGLLSPLTFDRRINVVRILAPRFLDDDEVKELKSDLTELKTTRNAMAHNPFWFQPESNDRGEVVNLVPIILIGKLPTPLTTPFVEKKNIQIASLIERTAALAKAVAEHEQSRK